jgi:hypothetical protein
MSSTFQKTGRGIRRLADLEAIPSKSVVGNPTDATARPQAWTIEGLAAALADEGLSTDAALAAEEAARIAGDSAEAAARIAGDSAEASARASAIAAEESARIAGDAARLPLAGGTMTGQLVSVAGTAGAPGVRIGGDAGNGVFRRGLNDLGVARGGADDGSWRGVQTGSFVPTIVAATPGDLSIAYAIQSASFIRIGNLVTARGLVRFTPTFTGASGAVTIAGMPFTNSSLVDLCLVWLSGAGYTSHVLAYINASSTSITLIKNNNAVMTVADLLVSGVQRDFYFRLVYQAV